MQRALHDNIIPIQTQILGANKWVGGTEFKSEDAKSNLTVGQTIPASAIFSSSTLMLRCLMLGLNPCRDRGSGKFASLTIDLSSL